MYSNDIITLWEEGRKRDLKKHSKAELQAVMKNCGLSSGIAVAKLRVLVLSLKHHKLPVCKKQVVELLKKHGKPVSGTL